MYKKYLLSTLVLFFVLISPSLRLLPSQAHAKKSIISKRKKYKKKGRAKVSISVKAAIGSTTILTIILVGGITVHKYCFSIEDASNQEKDTPNSLKVSNDNEKALSPKPIHEETNESTNTHSQKQSAISLNKNILNSENSTKKEDASNQEKDTPNSLKVSNIVRDRRIDSTIPVLRFKQLDNEELMLVSAFSSDSSE